MADETHNQRLQREANAQAYRVEVRRLQQRWHAAYEEHILAASVQAESATGVAKEIALQQVDFLRGVKDEEPSCDAEDPDTAYPDVQAAQAALKPTIAAMVPSQRLQLWGYKGRTAEAGRPAVRGFCSIDHITSMLKPLANVVDLR